MEIRRSVLRRSSSTTCALIELALRTQTNNPPVFTVEVLEVKQETLSYDILAVGSVEPFEVVSVTARIAGVVEKVNRVMTGMFGMSKLITAALEAAANGD